MQKTLPGLEKAKAELMQAIVHQRTIGLTQEFSETLGNIDRAATHLLTSPLFRGTDAAAQVELFSTSKP